MRSKPLKISPFPTTLRVKFTSKLPDEDVLGLTTLEGSQIAISICTSDPSKVPSTIVHEAVHAMQFTQSYVQGSFDDETQAYLVEQIASWLHQQWERVNSQHGTKQTKLH